MAYVSVPKDLEKIKSKVVLNLTARQIVCFATAAVMGLPFYFLTKDALGTGNAGAGMVLLMLPAFLFAMYEKDGLPFEKVVRNIIRARFLRPGPRPYRTQNIYAPFAGKEVSASEHKDQKRRARKGR